MDGASQKLHLRLTRFYTKYAPTIGYLDEDAIRQMEAKYTELYPKYGDQTETVMFQSLVDKYGPEPLEGEVLPRFSSASAPEGSYVPPHFSSNQQQPPTSGSNVILVQHDDSDVYHPTPAVTFSLIAAILACVLTVLSTVHPLMEFSVSTPSFLGTSGTVDLQVFVMHVTAEMEASTVLGLKTSKSLTVSIDDIPCTSLKSTLDIARAAIFAAVFFNAVFVLSGFRRLFAPAGLCNAVFLLLWGLCHAVALGTEFIVFKGDYTNIHIPHTSSGSTSGSANAAICDFIEALQGTSGSPTSGIYTLGVAFLLGCSCLAMEMCCLKRKNRPAANVMGFMVPNNSAAAWQQQQQPFLDDHNNEQQLQTHPRLGSHTLLRN